MRRIPLSLLAVAATLPVLGCDSLLHGTSTETAQEVTVHTITLDQTTCPTRVTVGVVVGTGACDTLLEPEITRRDGVVDIHFWVERTDGVCTLQLIGHQLTVELGSDFEPGTYRLEVSPTPRSNLSLDDLSFAYPDGC